MNSSSESLESPSGEDEVPHNVVSSAEQKPTKPDKEAEIEKSGPNVAKSSSEEEIAKSEDKNPDVTKSGSEEKSLNLKRKSLKY